MLNRHKIHQTDLNCLSLSAKIMLVLDCLHQIQNHDDSFFKSEGPYHQ